MKTDSRVGLIENNLNYGFVKSSTNVLLSSDADANIFLMADLQDPPELIKDLIKEWEKNINSVIFCVRKSSKENKLLRSLTRDPHIRGGQPPDMVRSTC